MFAANTIKLVKRWWARRVDGRKVSPGHSAAWIEGDRENGVPGKTLVDVVRQQRLERSPVEGLMQDVGAPGAQRPRIIK